MKLQLFPLWDLFTGSWQGANSARIVQSRPVKLLEAPLSWSTFMTGISLKSPRHWSLTAYDITKDTPDRCLHGILQHFKRELVVLIMVVVWKGTMQAPQETFDQTLLLVQCHGTVSIPGKGPFLAEWLTSDLWMQTSFEPSLFISEHFYTGAYIVPGVQEPHNWGERIPIDLGLYLGSTEGLWVTLFIKTGCY